MTETDTKVWVTLKLIEPVMTSSVATILTCPVATAVTNPDLLTVAIPADEELQLTLEVTFFVLPSLYFAVAVNCSLWPTVIDPLAEATAIEINDAVELDEVGGVKFESAPLPQPASKSSHVNEKHSETRVCIVKTAPELDCRGGSSHHFRGSLSTIP
jgi:hypothetical protein